MVLDSVKMNLELKFTEFDLKIVKKKDEKLCRIKKSLYLCRGKIMIAD